MVEQADRIIDSAESGAVLTDTSMLPQKQSHSASSTDSLQEYPPPQGISMLSGLLAAHHHLQANSKTGPINGGELNYGESEHKQLLESIEDTITMDDKPSLDVEGVETPNSISTITTAFSEEELRELAEQMEAAAEMERRMSVDTDTSVPLIDHDDKGNRQSSRKRKSSSSSTETNCNEPPLVKRKPGRPRKNSMSEKQRQFEQSVVSPSAKWPAVVVGDPVKELQRACQYGQTVSVETMLKKGNVSVTDTDINQNTALHEAAVYGKAEVVKVLIKYGAPLEPRNVLNETPLQLSRSPQVTLLLKEFLARMAASRPKLHNAIISDDLEQLRVLLKEETGSTINDTDEMGFHCLHWCAIKNRPDMIKLIKDSFPNKLNINIQSQCQQRLTPLHEASRFNSPEALQCLLDCGADPLQADANEMLPVDHAPNKIIRRIFRRFGRKHGIPDLLRSPRLPEEMNGEGDDPDSTFTLDTEDGPSSSVGFTREERKLQQVLNILGRSDGSVANSNSKSQLRSTESVPKKRGRPPKPKPQVGAAGPEITFRDKSTGRTLLHRYAGKGDLAMVKELLSSDPNLLTIVDNAGYTALHEASLKGRKETVKELLKAAKKHGKPDLIDMQSATTGDTALHDAVENGHHSVVKLLLESGANRRLANKAGLMAHQVCDKEDEEMKSIFGVLPVDTVPVEIATVPKTRKSTEKAKSFDGPVVKRKPGRPRKVPAEAMVPEKERTELSPLLLVNLDAALPAASPPTTLWHFLSCQLEDRSPSFPLRHRTQYGRELTHADRSRLLSTPAISALHPLCSALRDPLRPIFLVDKDAVYKAARHAHGRLKVLDDATIQYVDVGKPQGGKEVHSVPLKMKMKQQWRK